MEKKPTVLIIDDEQDLRDMMAFQFKSRGFNAETAANGVEGLEKLPIVNPALIILDLNMPKMGGIEFYQRIVGANGQPSHPVLVLTARANTEQLFRDLNVDGFITKPFEIDTVIKEAETIIKKHSRLAPAKKGDAGGVRTVYVADSDQAALDATSVALLNAGYRVATAKTGVTMLELLTAEPPTLALVKLGLPDISGDLVVLRARRMAKTSDIKFVLFEPRDSRHLRSVREKIGDKSGVMELVEYETASDLLRAVDSGIRKGEVENEEGA